MVPARWRRACRTHSSDLSAVLQLRDVARQDQVVPLSRWGLHGKTWAGAAAWGADGRRGRGVSRPREQ
eukprot:727875-Alexandrium_andersonii.AAC.1